jgi:sigma-B regulation protein RsbU (phosphoserine phosphatase)
MIIPALLFWLELSLGKLRRLLQITLIAALMVGVAGVCSTLITGLPGRILPYNNLLGIWTLLVLSAVIALPYLAKRFLVVQSRIAAIGLLVFAIAALHSNLKVFLHLPNYPFLEPLAYAMFTLSLGYVAAEKVFADERRLLSIENELEIASEIQRSILPTGTPELKSLRISATYRPMTAVAGDFYEFILVDQNRVGFFVADVSGHGVPAALIASMIKVAMQWVVSCAHDPAQVLRGLNRNLSGQLRSQLVSAAYLWVDTKTREAFYSAAGHPPAVLEARQVGAHRKQRFTVWGQIGF